MFTIHWAGARNYVQLVDPRFSAASDSTENGYPAAAISVTMLARKKLNVSREQTIAANDYGTKD